MWGKRVIEQIDTYLKVYADFEQYDWDSFFDCLIAYAEEKYDSIMEDRERAIKEYPKLQSIYKEQKKYLEKKREVIYWENEISQIENKIEKKKATVPKLQKQIKELNQIIDSDKRIFWKRHVKEEAEIEQLIRRLEKNDAEVEKLNKKVGEIKEQQELLKQELSDAEASWEKCFDGNIGWETLEENEKQQKELEKLIFGCNDIMLQSIEEFNPFTNEDFLNFHAWKDIYWSAANVRTMGPLTKAFVELQQILFLVEETPFVGGETLSDRYSIPCQEKFERLMRNACRRLDLKDTVVFRWISSSRSDYKEMLEQLAKCQGDMTKIIPEALKDSLCRDIPDERDEFFDEAVAMCIDKGEISIGTLQRNFKIGFNRAARIIDSMEACGLLGPEEGIKPRKLSYSSSWKDCKSLGTANSDATSASCYSKQQYVAKHLYDYSLWVLSKDFINEIKIIIEKEPEINLPTLALALLKVTNRMDLECEIREFKELYEASPEEVMIVNQRYLQEEELWIMREQRKVDENAARRRCENCAYYIQCDSVGLISCGSYVPKTRW